MTHHQTIRPLLISLIKGARVTKSEDQKLVKFINSLEKKDIEQVSDRLVMYLRQELKVLVTDKFIEQTAKALGGNNQTAYEDFDC